MQIKLHARVHCRVAQVIIVITALCTTFLLTGCKSPGYKKGDSAAVSIENAAAEVQGESRALELTMGALKDLANQNQADLKLQFQHFSSSLDKLDTAAKRTATTGKRMEEKQAAYLQAWDKELAGIDYQKVRDLSQTRKTEVAGRFEAVKQRYKESQEAVQPLISYLQDVRKALSTDLTPEGLTSLKEVVANADQNAAKVQAALAALTNELTNSSSRLVSIGAQSQTAQSQ